MAQHAEAQSWVAMLLVLCSQLSHAATAFAATIVRLTASINDESVLCEDISWVAEYNGIFSTGYRRGGRANNEAVAGDLCVSLFRAGHQLFLVKDQMLDQIRLGAGRGSSAQSVGSNARQ